MAVELERVEAGSAHLTVREKVLFDILERSKSIPVFETKAGLRSW